MGYQMTDGDQYSRGGLLNRLFCGNLQIELFCMIIDVRSYK